MEKLIIVIALSGILISCDNDSCSNDIGCTEEFVMVGTSVVDSDNDPIELDSTRTINSDGVLIFSYVKGQVPLSDNYTVVTDSEMDLLESSGSRLTMRGWQDGTELFEEDFTVGKDCCHIEKIDGPEVIIID